MLSKKQVKFNFDIVAKREKPNPLFRQGSRKAEKEGWVLPFTGLAIFYFVSFESLGCIANRLYRVSKKQYENNSKGV